MITQEQRIQELEKEGLTRSDAQGADEVYTTNELKKKLVNNDPFIRGYIRQIVRAVGNQSANGKLDLAKVINSIYEAGFTDGHAAGKVKS